MYDLLVVIGFLAVVGLVGWSARRHEREVDDYYEREFRDPPAHGWSLGNVAAVDLWSSVLPAVASDV